MSALPFSPAAATAAEHACSRHAHILGPRFCAECRAPLCTACVRTSAHRTCPSCNLAAGRKASVYDVGWYAALFADGLAHAARTVKTRVLPFAIATSMLALAGVIGVVASVGERTAGAEAMSGVAFGALGLVVVAGLCLQPALSLPTVARVGFWRRTLRSVVGTALPVLAVFVVLFVSGVLVAAGDQWRNLALTFVGVLLSGGVVIVAFVLSATLLPTQAAYAIGGRSLLGALKVPFAGGAAGLATQMVTWMMLLSMLYSGLYLLLIPVLILVVISPWLGAVFGIAAACAGLVLTLVVTAAYASASLRLCEDRSGP